ncbi:ATP-binding protein [Streptomyces sp. NPDC047042]|uniref:ATP-binding protein n=1 Tax=Streptomyces sp. NPDC047042 TaxID=3154807 RepID=UPI0033F175A4
MLCEPRTARRARLLVSAALHTWNLSDLVETGMLMVSELVGNSVQHTACRLIHVSVRRIAIDRVRIGVTENSSRLPEMGGGESGREGGRGLFLVEVMGDRWGYDLHRRGKTVWVELVVEGGEKPGLA